MKWYSVIRFANAVDDPYVSDTDNLGGFEDWQLSSGERIENWPETAWIQATRADYDGTPDDVLQSHLGVPIYSSRLRTLLDDAGIKGIQYLPLTVLRPDNSIISGFAIANIANKVAALDLDNSDYDVFPDDYFLPSRRGTISGVRKYVLRKDQLRQYDILRLQEYLAGLFVSERFKKAFEADACTGYAFEKVGTM